MEFTIPTGTTVVVIKQDVPMDRIDEFMSLEGLMVLAGIPVKIEFYGVTPKTINELSIKIGDSGGIEIAGYIAGDAVHYDEG